jgi:uncharacterized membrane protein
VLTAIILIVTAAMSYVFAIPGKGKGTKRLRLIRIGSLATIPTTIGAAAYGLVFLWT